MDKFYHLLTLAGIGLYWLLVAGVTIRVVLKRRAVSVSLAWLMISYILPVLGVACYFLIGELNLGRKRAERAKEMFTPFEKWFSQLNDCNAHNPETMGRHIYRIDELCNNRLGLPALSGNTLSLQQSPNEILHSIIEDIENAQDMSVEERQDFIRSMVERLATRLEDEPDDLDGWMRLGNAYSVLGDTAPAIAAFEHAEILLSEVPGDDPRRQAVQSALERLRP